MSWGYWEVLGGGRLWAVMGGVGRLWWWGNLRWGWEAGTGGRCGREREKGGRGERGRREMNFDF